MLGLPADFTASAFNPHFKRANDWLATRQKDVDAFAKVSVASCCWLAGGLVGVIAARLAHVAPSHIADATVAMDQLLALAAEPSPAPVTARAIPERDIELDADLAVIRAINLARELGRLASSDGPFNNTDYLVEGLRVGVLWVLWGEQAVHQFNPWYKHARRVIVASDKRTDAPRSRLGNLLGRHLLDANVPVTKAAFARATSQPSPA